MRILLATLLLGLAPLPDGLASEASERIRAFNEQLESIVGVGEPRRTMLVSQFYRANLEDFDTHAAKDGDLHDYFLAAVTASGLSHSKQAALDARAAFDELRLRNALTATDYRYMQGLYVGLRAFDEARRFHETNRENADLESLPRITTAPAFDRTRATVLEPVADGLLRRNLRMGKGSFVVVVSDPLCHFTQDAVADIQSDPVLKDYFSKNSSWLVPTGLGLQLPPIEAWNKHLPNYPMVLVDDVRTWKDIDYWGTPTFYFYENGKLVHTLRGWPKEGHVDELKAIIGAAGE
jgi:hypothetical protein